MKPRPIRMLLTVAIVIVGYYAVLFFAQRRILFPAPSSPGITSLRNAQFVQIATPTGVVDAYYLAPTSHAAGAAPLFLFTHGNAELATAWVGAFDEPRSWGFGVLLLEYPGYGGAAGSPSERSVTNAVLAAYDWAAHDSRFDSTRIVAVGRSIGTGAAAHLAAGRPVAAVILQSPFTSVRAFARTVLAPGFLVRDPFDNVANLRNYHGPLLVLHGDHDEVIPTAEGRALAAGVPGSEFSLLACGHNDCELPWPLIRDFLSRRGIWPRR